MRAGRDIVGAMVRRPRTVIAVLGMTIAAWSIAAVAIDRTGSRPPPAGRYHAIVVLGCSVGADGRASPALARRVREGARLWHEGRAPILVLTGGVGTHPPSEARAAREIALERGVPEDAIVLEERSTSTEENARFARELVTAERVLLVTDGFHALRARRIFGRFFAHVDFAPVTAGPWVRGKGALREVPLLALAVLAR
jgi:uncharacterized SAM-binding protein YcdF (DUF218 family)